MHILKFFVAALFGAAVILPAHAVAQKSATAQKAAAVPPGTKATLRFCWWTPPEEIPVLALVQEKEMVGISPDIMSLSIKTEYLGPPVVSVVRQVVGPERDKKGNPVLIWIPYASINLPKDGADLAVLLIPRPKGEVLTQVFDFSEEAFPYGTVQFINYTNAKVQARINQTVMQIPSRGRSRYPGQFTKRQPANFTLEVTEPNEEPLLVASTTMVFFPNSRLLFFIIESPGAKKEGRYHNSVIMENKVEPPPVRPAPMAETKEPDPRAKSKAKPKAEPAK